MSSRLQVTIAVIALASVLVGTALTGLSCADRSIDSFVPPLKVMGDVESPIAVGELDESRFEIESVELREATVRALSLDELVQEAVPRSEDFDVLLVGDDGRSAIIGGGDLSGSRVVFSADYGWEAINREHPVSSNVKMLREVVIIARGLFPGEGFSVMDTESDLLHLSPGELYRDGYLVRPRHVGSASVAGDSGELGADIFERERVIDLGQFTDLSDRDSVLVFGENGEVQGLRQDGSFLLGDHNVSYRDGEVSIEGVRGLVLDPPERMITDVYHDAHRLLERDERVLLILLDGFGYHTYLRAAEMGCTPFLASLPGPEMALSVYPSVTVVNFTAALTGVTPDVSGVRARGIRSAEVPTIFGLCQEMGWEAQAVLGPMGVIDLEIDPVLCVDADGDDSSDDEIRDAALAEMSHDHDLLLVHFKDIDRAGHTYGEMAGETLEAMRRIDGFVEELVGAWPGRVMIFADHGMHSTGATAEGEKRGDHGFVIVQDMITPYWELDGGRYRE
ncbi:MAG: alkaline phosphatase family protein [Bacillota bacterium]